MSSSTTPIQNLLQKDDTSLGKLIAQARAIETLNETFKQLIEPALIPHCKVGCYQSGVLTLFVENAAWATKLRYMVPTLLSQLRSIPQWAGLSSIQIKVQTHWYQELAYTTPPTQEPPLLLSEATAQRLHALAESLKNLPENELLVKALERLANNT